MSEFECKLLLDFSDVKNAETVFSAVIPETTSLPNKRAETIVNIKNACISINIKALDKTALKAGLNSCLKSIILAEELSEVV